MISQNVFIIAEAGVNHNGDLELAKRLVEKAKEAGANAVKFQTFKASKLVTSTAKQADYQTKNTGIQETQLAMLKKLEQSYEEQIQISKYCKELDIIFLSSSFDDESSDFLNSILDIPLFKIPSGEITNLPYLKKIASFKKPIILSTGMCSMSDIEGGLNLLLKNHIKREDIYVLHCSTEYPTPMEEVNLFAMNTIKNAFQVTVGYSDHTEGIEVPIAAVALGARIIEKHFTLNKNFEGPDHKASLDPQELKEMVLRIRNIEKALGSPIKNPTTSELKNIKVARKSIVASIPIKKGEIFSEDNLTTKRPGTGISPMEWERIIGTPSPKDFYQDEIITW
jgi:N-acetylneuraminate synthase